MTYLYVRNWNRWQTYRNDRGQPPWIKLHRRVMRNLDWIKLSNAERGALMAVWLLAADDEGRIPDDPVLVGRLCYMDEIPDLDALVEQGWLSKNRKDLGEKPKKGDTETPSEGQPDAESTPERRQRDANVTPSGRQSDVGVTPSRARVEAEAEYSEVEPEEKARARAVPVVQNGQSPLATKVLAAFVEKSADKGLTWPPTEMEHVNRLVERAEMEPDPEAWCKRFLETAWRLKQSGTWIWKDRPWMPRTFCGVKAITWVIEAMGSQNDAGDEASRRYYAEKIANRQAGRK